MDIGSVKQLQTILLYGLYREHIQYGLYYISLMSSIRQRSSAPSHNPVQSQTTLNFLRKKGLIQQTIKLQNIETEIFSYRPFFRISLFQNLKQKYLLKNRNNVIYYGPLSEEGSPENHQKQLENKTTIENLRGVREEDCSGAIMIFKDGTYYLGEFVNGVPQGCGIFTNCQNSFMYTGTFMDGVPDGIGIEIVGGNVYEGQFKKGKKHGMGTLKYFGGNCYEGHFSNNQIEGNGQYSYKNKIWSGSWKKGFLEGQGRQIIAKFNLNDLTQASEYVGTFKNGERHGNGHYAWGRGYQYQGNFNKGQLDGEGIFKFNNKIYKGTWSNGMQVKMKEIRKNDSSISSGSMIHSKLSKGSSRIT